MPDPRLLLSLQGRVVIGRYRPWVKRATTWFWVDRGKYRLTVCYVPFRGYQARSIRLRGGSPLDVLHHFPPAEFSVKKVLLGQGESGGTVEHLAAVECNVLHTCPGLVKHCCITQYEDKSPRVPGWWTVQTRGAAWQVVVKDPDSGCKLVATGNTLDDALALAELLLTSESAPWERDPYLKLTNGKGKKGT